MVSTATGKLDVDAPERSRSFRSSCLALVGSRCAGRDFVFLRVGLSHSVALALTSAGLELNSWLQGSEPPPF